VEDARAAPSGRASVDKKGMGLPGAGKTTLATALAHLLNAVVFNADAVRNNLSRDLGFSHEDRIEHVRRMGWMCDRVVRRAAVSVMNLRRLMCGWPPPGKRSFGVQHRGRLQSCVPAC
jgi:Adenylylsulphate kinase